MAWQRSIPFGYRMEQAEIIREQTEAEAVKRIFTLYLGGHSLSQIAEAMTEQGVRYHAHTEAWNKNMVKRILDNRRYLGDGEYPRIITSDDFLTAQLLKTEKISLREPCPEEIRPMGRIIVCAVCGSKMRRQTKTGRTPRWVCQNEDCRKTAIISDDALFAEIQRCLAKLTLSPELLAVSAPRQPTRSMDALRLENELTAAFNRNTESAEYMKTLIFALAAEKYKALPDMSAEHEMITLQKEIAEHEIDTNTLIRKSVRRILLQRNADVAIELRNGIIIPAGEEAAQ